ncbi:MAG: hypothetical protein AAB969_04125, partial [Patescibacteria group bacterium]
QSTFRYFLTHILNAKIFLKLQESNFQFKENLSDYQINLGFWKDDVFGIMSFSDKKKDIDGGVKYNSDVNITVNYLNELKK